MSDVPLQHIGHVFPTRSWGGAEIYAVQLATWQRDAGQTVSVWCPPDSRLGQEARARGLRVVEINLPQRRPFVALRAILRGINAERVTHFHHHWSGGPWTFLGAHRLSGVRSVVHLHLWISRAKRDLLHRYLYRSIDAVIVAGERAARAARELLPLKEDQVHIVPYAMSFEKFKHVEPVSPALEIPTGGVRIGMFARLDQQKGTLELLESAKEFLEKLPDVSLIIMGAPNVGDPDGYAERVRAACASHPFAERIRLVPFRPDYLTVMNVCSLVVAPSYHESYSLVFLDAFALGIPVLTTDIGGSPDLVTPERGWLVEPRDVKSLAAGILQALASPEELRRRGEAAKAYVFANHSPQAVIAKMKSVYR